MSGSGGAGGSSGSAGTSSAGGSSSTGGTSSFGGSGGTSSVGGAGGTSGGAGSGAYGGAGGTAGAGTGGSAGSGGSGGVPTNVLTVGAWDDNLNFEFFQTYLAQHPALDGRPGFTSAEYSAAHVTFAVRAPRQVVDATLVIDTTGSMGDELSYLAGEFESISGSIRAAFPDADQRWALIVYRDGGDAYVVRSIDFTGVAADFATSLSLERADGGGDYPEAPDQGLAALAELSWRSSGSVARLAFWVADAPHHVEQAAAMRSAIVSAKNAGIHLYPVAASGADELLEYTMRSAAQLTGGRYLFLTDDSGIGGSHKEPEIPCYFVTKLESALVRVVAMELSGQALEPAPAEILRAVGNPIAGQCVLGDGESVSIF